MTEAHFSGKNAAQAPLAQEDIILAPYCPLYFVGGDVGRSQAGSPGRTYHSVVKPLIDIVLAGIALLFCLPIFLIVALAISLESPGPIFFRQERRGLNGRPFQIWKFRTLHQGTEAQKNSCDPDDVRITKLGKLLRTSKADELPQLLNILVGDMSIIGPRPLPEALSVDIERLNFAPHHEGFVHDVKPGLIGLEQINRHRGLDWQQRFAYNAQYEKNLSWSLDLRIFLISLVQCRLLCSLVSIVAVVETIILFVLS